MITAVVLAVIGLIDFYRWEYSYGHELDPNAAIKVPGMTYQPPMFGTKQLLNFYATAWPGIGGIAAMLGAVGRDLPQTEEEAAEIFLKIGTIDLRVDYLRPGVGEWYDASAVVLRTGARVAVTRMEMRNDADKLIAVGTGTYTVG